MRFLCYYYFKSKMHILILILQCQKYSLTPPCSDFSLWINNSFFIQKTVTTEPCVELSISIQIFNPKEKSTGLILPPSHYFSFNGYRSFSIPVLHSSYCPESFVFIPMVLQPRWQRYHWNGQGARNMHQGSIYLGQGNWLIGFLFFCL